VKTDNNKISVKFFGYDHAQGDSKTRSLIISEEFIWNFIIINFHL